MCWTKFTNPEIVVWISKLFVIEYSPIRLTDHRIMVQTMEPLSGCETHLLSLLAHPCMSSPEQCTAVAKANESARKAGVTDGLMSGNRERERQLVAFFGVWSYDYKIEY